MLAPCPFSLYGLETMSLIASSPCATRSLSRYQLQRVQAQVDVGFSISLIEAFWRTAEHNCRFQKSLNSLAAFRQWTDF